MRSVVGAEEILLQLPSPCGRVLCVHRDLGVSANHFFAASNIFDTETHMTKAEQTRLRAWRLKILQQATEASRNVARTCRHFGISRQAFYKWKRRYDTYGEAGLCDRSRTPHRSPRATPREVVSKILY